MYLRLDRCGCAAAVTHFNPNDFEKNPQNTVGQDGFENLLFGRCLWKISVSHRKPRGDFITVLLQLTAKQNVNIWWFCKLSSLKPTLFTICYSSTTSPQVCWHPEKYFIVWNISQTLLIAVNSCMLLWVEPISKDLLLMTRRWFCLWGSVSLLNGFSDVKTTEQLSTKLSRRTGRGPRRNSLNWTKDKCPKIQLFFKVVS